METEIQKCVDILRKGGCILYPTDTIWGIGCDATNSRAVAKVYAIKQREDSKAMLVLVDSIAMIRRYVEEIPEIALNILEINEHPLTIIYPGAFGLAENLIAEDGSIGMRISREPFSAGLIKAFRKPVLSTSANLAGEPAPENFSGVSSKIKTQMDHVANWKQDLDIKNKPSGILKVYLNGEFKILRQ